jgi:hypothetical protein
LRLHHYIILVLLCLTIAAACRVTNKENSDQQEMTTKKAPGSWFWSHDIEQSNISSLITPGTRLVRLSSYRNKDRLRYAALLYMESGPATRYSFDLSAKEALDSLQNNTRRVISVTTDTHDETLKFSLITEENVASTSTLKTDLDEAGLKGLVNGQQGITDLTTYSVSGKRLFAAIVEPRSTPSWVFVGVTASELDQQLRKLKAALVRLRSYQSIGGKRLYTAVAEPVEAGTTTWWYADLSADEVASKLEDHDAYPVDLDAMDYNDKLRFTVIMRR